MSSHEHRFRLFSSVEYEGQLYMTPQNFIESVTMSEPRSRRRTSRNTDSLASLLRKCMLLATLGLLKFNC